MFKQVKLLATLLVAGSLCVPAHAAEFVVGRADVVFPTEGWRETVLPDPGLAYTGDRVGSRTSETKLFVKESPQHQIEAVVLLRGTKGGVAGGYMTYSRSCEGGDDFFAEGTTGDALRVSHCLHVFPLYTVSSLLADMGEAVQSAMKDHEGKLSKAMYSVTSDYSNSNGTTLRAYVLLAPGFKGLPSPSEGKLPTGINSSHVAWGRELHRAVRGCVNSIFGKMTFPDMTFTAPARSQDYRVTLYQAQ